MVGERLRDAGAGGMALPLMLLLLLALTALGHGALLLSTRELQATWAFRHAVRAAQASEAGAWSAFQRREVMPEDRTPWIPHLLVEGDSPDGLTYRGLLRWLDGEYFLLEGTGRSRGWKGERRAGWVGWSLLPEARLKAFRAAAEVGGALTLGVEARAESLAFRDPPDGWEDSHCTAYVQAADSLFSGGLLPLLGGLPAWPRFPHEEGDSIPPLGLLGGPELLRRAEEAGEVGSWFFAGDSVRGCPDGGQPPVFEGTPESLRLEGGRLCGLLVVEGDLRMEGTARFQGLVLVGGELILEGRAVLEGMARVGGGLHILDSARFRSSACPALRAMDELSVLQEPLLLRGGSRINGF